ncbi:hypothetical protein [uncultured Brachyspira sp.]|uniref:hypothetical protein n=1 Tax=uncultured Brachyspira sp. TaxID=221953 RepID=UPI002599BCD2|nr:hypothetical protein [uncultured Brachyspira sp.]
MRLLYNNIFNNCNYTASSSDEFFDIENIFDYHTQNVGRFDNKLYGSLEITGNGIINSFAIFNTNAYFVKIEIYNNIDDNRIYLIDIFDNKAMHNIHPVEFTRCKISFYGNERNENNLEIGYLIVGEALDFPPHDKQKTHTISYTHEQYFSISNHYFPRLLPTKKYEVWKVSFPYLTNSDKDKILNFFNESNFYPFVLQVWTGEVLSVNATLDRYYAKYNISKYNKSKYKFTKEDIRYARYNISKYNISKYKAKADFQYPKYYMKSGLYVCTNTEIDFKKGKNDLYQYSTELTFREIQ